MKQCYSNLDHSADIILTRKLVKLYRWLPLLMLLTFLGCTRIVDSTGPKSDDWTTYKTEHYIFHVRSGSPADSSIQQIQHELEWAYHRINERLGLSFNQKLMVYIYDSERDMGTTQKTGKAYPGLSTIEAIYNSELKSIGVRGVSLHELSHIVAYYEWCPSPAPLFAEGLAVWLDDYWSLSGIQTTNLFAISKIRLRQDNLPTVGQLINNWNAISASISYPSAGAFAKYLIDEYGLGAYKQLYCEARQDNFETVFFDIYQKRIGELESEYHSFLRNF